MSKALQVWLTKDELVRLDILLTHELSKGVGDVLLKNVSDKLKKALNKKEVS